MTDPDLVSVYHWASGMLILMLFGLLVYATDKAREYKKRCGELGIELCQMRERAERAEGSPHHEIARGEPAVVVRLPTDASCKICGGNCGQCGGPCG